MSGSSIVVLGLVVIFFGDLLPNSKQVEIVTDELRTAPTYTVEHFRPDLDSFYQDCQGVRRQFLAVPATARSLWFHVHDNARVLYSQARDEAHKLGERISSHPESH